MIILYGFSVENTQEYKSDTNMLIGNIAKLTLTRICLGISPRRRDIQKPKPSHCPLVHHGRIVSTVCRCFRSMSFNHVGGFNTFEKHKSKWESSPNRGEN